MSEYAATTIWWITEDGRYFRQEPEGECVKYIKASCAEGGEQALQAQLAEAEKREKRLRQIAESVANYKKSELFKEWQEEHIAKLPPGEQIDFMQYQAVQAHLALKN